ncbi:MAG: rod shape-determining protein [Anaplasmataceae bacterium]|nr:rod shape-determining protein [Anaplasmataceae bacterium]
MNILDYIYTDVGIDLGTANVLIYARGRGIVVDEPSVTAINRKTNRIVAVGDDAKKMLARTPAHIEVVRPLVNGVVSDFEMTQELLRHFFKRLDRGLSFGFRRGVIAIPDGLTEVEQKSVEDAALNAGCSKVFLVQSPLAAALGANLPIDTPTASLIIDIGGGTTDVAVISMGGIVISRTLKIAGDKFNDDIIKFVRDEFKLIIGEPTAEMAKIMIGTAIASEHRPDGHTEIALKGRDVASGLPREVVMKGNHIRAALLKSVKTIVETTQEVIESTPPELAGDLLRQGIYLCGGGALLWGLDKLIEKETSVTTSVVEDPLTCVARGLGRLVDNFEERKSLFTDPLKPLEISLS